MNYTLSFTNLNRYNFCDLDFPERTLRKMGRIEHTNEDHYPKYGSLYEVTRVSNKYSRWEEGYGHGNTMISGQIRKECLCAHKRGS